MTITTEAIHSAVRSFSLITSSDLVANGMIRMATPFTYPNGSHIDLFITPNLDAAGRLELSDLGLTLDYLADLGIRPNSTAKRKQVVTDICKSLDVDLSGGAFRAFMPHDQLDALPQTMIRLGQACLRVAEMQWSQRFRTASVFQDDIEEAIEGMGLEYEANPVLEGVGSIQVTMDFLVRGAHQQSAVRTLSTANRVAAHGMANEALRSFFVIRDSHRELQRVTIYDATQDIFRAEDLRILEDLSLVLGYPSQADGIREALAA